MKMIETGIEGVFIIEPNIHEDQRGYFMESYNQFEHERLGLKGKFIQDNQSLSIQAGTIRGLHYQLEPKAQTKLVRVSLGAIYDVVVDIRTQSPSFGEWTGVILSDENKRQLLVPKGFAHGFCTLVRNTQVEYKVDQYYSAEHDRGLLWSDPALAISWPFSDPTLSDKDRLHPVLKDAENNF